MYLHNISFGFAEKFCGTGLKFKVADKNTQIACFERGGGQGLLVQGNEHLSLRGTQKYEKPSWLGANLFGWASQANSVHGKY